MNISIFVHVSSGVIEEVTPFTSQDMAEAHAADLFSVDKNAEDWPNNLWEEFEEINEGDDTVTIINTEIFS